MGIQSGKSWLLIGMYNNVCLLAGIDLNSLRLIQNRHHFADDIFKCIFVNEIIWVLIKIPLKFVPKCPINNISALVQIMAWRRPGDKPFSEPMMVSLLMHICVIRPQWVKKKEITLEEMQQRTILIPGLDINDQGWKAWNKFVNVCNFQTPFNHQYLEYLFPVIMPSFLTFRSSLMMSQYWFK